VLPPLQHRSISIEELRTQMQQSFGHLPLQQRKFIRYGNCDEGDWGEGGPGKSLDEFELWQQPFSHYVNVADGADEHAERVRDLLNRLSSRGFSV
jgi:hypothetical protein